jgi:hypothetical protein
MTYLCGVSHGQMAKVELMTVLFFFERALRDLSGTEFTLVIQRFLRITRTHPLNYAMVLTSGFVPIALLVMLRENPSSPSFVLIAAGLLAFWCGPCSPRASWPSRSTGYS